MQGSPAKSLQLKEEIFAANSTYEESVGVVKNTHFVPADGLDEYLRELNTKNCHVVVQNVEPGSAMSLELDRRLKAMQQQKLGISASNDQLDHPLPDNKSNGTLRKQAPQNFIDPIAIEEPTAVYGNYKKQELQPANISLNAINELHDKHVQHDQSHQEVELKRGIATLLMQMKQISLVPRMNTCTTNNSNSNISNNNGRNDNFSIPAADMYSLSTKAGSSEALKDNYSNMQQENANDRQSNLDKLASVKYMETSEARWIYNDSNNGNTQGKTPQSYQQPHVGQYSSTVSNSDVSGYSDFGGKNMGQKPREWQNQYYEQKSLSSDTYSGVSGIEPNQIMDESELDMRLADITETKLVKRYTPTSRPTHPDNTGEQKEVKGETPSTTMQKGLVESEVPRMSARRVQRNVASNNMKPRRKAVVVGCSYPGDNEAFLRGTCNDALLFATTLVTHLGFDVDDVLLLIDTEPADIYIQQLSILSSSQSVMNEGRPSSGGRRKTGIIGGFLSGLVDDVFSVMKPDQQLDIPELLMLDSPGQPVPECNKPTRANILKALRWLTSNTSAGDSGVFYFSGHSVQTDDMSGWEGEGYDEALVPCDYMESGDPSRGIILAQQVKQLIQSVDKCCQMTVIMDTVGMQTVLDPAGRVGPWKFIKGAMLRGVWPLANATGKISCAAYDQEVWRDLTMQQQLVHPKFMPMIQIDCAASMLDGFISSNNINASSNSICIAAAPFPEVAIEALFKPMDLTGGALSSIQQSECEQVVCHGVFTYCLVSTILNDRSSKRGGITLAELSNGIQKRCRYLKSKRLPKLEQLCEVTIHPSGLANMNNFFLSPWGGRVIMHGNRINNLRHPYKGLSEGLRSFLSLPEAWMQLHNEGRVKAVEQRDKFGRMRSAVINVSRMVTADAKNAMMMNKQPCNSRAPSSNIMLGHIPMQQRIYAGNSWYGQATTPQNASPDCQDYMHGGTPLVYQRMTSPMQYHHQQQQQLLPQDYVIDSVIQTPQHIMQQNHPQQPPIDQWNMLYNPYHMPTQQQFGGYVQKTPAAFYHQRPAQQMQVPMEHCTHPARSHTYSMLEKQCCIKSAMPRTCTSAFKTAGFKLAKPITPALVSQLPVMHNYQ